jgi:hypothetical protein
MTRRKRETRGHKRGINITRKSVSDRCRRPEPFRHQAEQDRSTALQRASAMRPAPPHSLKWMTSGRAALTAGLPRRAR